MGRGMTVKRAIAVAATLALLVPLAAACGGEEAGEGGGEYPSETMRLMAPADPGGGWDQTARAMQAAFEQGRVTDQNVEVFNVPGAGGTVGLAELVSDHERDPYYLMVMGLVMLGAIRTNESEVDLSDVTPIARLTTEWEAIAVASNSKYKTLEQLIEDFKADPRSISWGGGSAGGTDHILIGMIAKEAGVNPSGINYVAHSGGGEAVAAILSGGVTAGVSGVAEFTEQVDAGKMRYLAVSSEEPLEGVDAPTLQESDLDVVLPNWRGVVAPPDLPDDERDAVIAAVERMHDTQQWQDALEQNGWEDYFATGDEFADFIGEEEERVDEVLKDIGLVK
jgi:putative tricarboxylic transport membrane protein